VEANPSTTTRLQNLANALYGSGSVRAITNRAKAYGKLDRMLLRAVRGRRSVPYSSKVVACLLEAGASLAAREDQRGRTPLYFAIRVGSLKMVELLLSTARARGELGERLQDTCGSGRYNVFHHAVITQNLHILRALLKSLNHLNSRKHLATAVRAGVGLEAFTTDIAKICVTYMYLPVNVLDAHDHTGHTPLIRLLDRCKCPKYALAAAKLLIQHGADPDLTTSRNRFSMYDCRPKVTALEVAQLKFKMHPPLSPLVGEGAGWWERGLCPRRRERAIETRRRENAKAAKLISYFESVTETRTSFNIMP